MNLFSISQLSQYSGIKPHTIRIWEQRYNALKPDRSVGNTRYYNSDQLRRLLNIVSLMETDYKVSELCTMPDDKLSAIVLSTKKSIEDEFDYFSSQLIAAGMNYQSDYFEELFEQCLLTYGMHQTYKKIIYPLLERIGLMWAGNELPSAQEHFISNIIRQKILKSIDSLPSAEPDSDKWLLFLPEDEFHEIGLLFTAYLLKESGRKVVYLGNSVSFESLVSAIMETKPDYLMLFTIHYNLPENVQNYLIELNKKFTGKKICIAGNYKLLSQIRYPEKVLWLQTIESLEKNIKE